MAVKIRVTQDFVEHEEDASLRIPAGTVIDNVDLDPEFGDAWYTHPFAEPEIAWMSLKGDFEVIDDE